MKQQSQTNLMIGMGAALTVAVVAGFFGLDYLSSKKETPTKSTPTNSTATPTDRADYSAAIASATESAAVTSTDSAGLNADEAKRIGEEVARQVAAQVAQAIVDERLGGGSSGGLSEAEARRIGEEEGRRVAQEVAAATVQQALAASGGGESSGMSVAEAEQIGMAAGRRAAKQVAASTARDVVRNEFGGSVVAAATETAAAEPAAPTAASPRAAQKSGGSDALHAWWTAPSSGDFGLLYAGQPKGEPAIALLFSQPPADSTLNQNVKVYDAAGSLVSGSWEPAANPRLAVLRGLQPGRYTVVVEPALANASGKVVKKAQHGPIYVI